MTNTPRLSQLHLDIRCRPALVKISHRPLFMFNFTRTGALPYKHRNAIYGWVSSLEASQEVPPFLFGWYTLQASECLSHKGTSTGDHTNCPDFICGRCERQSTFLFVSIFFHSHSLLAVWTRSQKTGEQMWCAMSGTVSPSGQTSSSVSDTLSYY